MTWHLIPNENAAKGAGEKRSFVARTFLGPRRALDSNEGAPGPIMLQGDHGPVEYRNLILIAR